MNTIKIILSATKHSPFTSHHNNNDLGELAKFAIEIDNLISAEKIMTQRGLMQNIRTFIKDNYLKEVDIKSALTLETQLNSLGEFCISLNKDWFKHYFIVKIVH